MDWLTLGQPSPVPCPHLLPPGGRDDGAEGTGAAAPLWNHHTGKSLCGRQVDRLGPGVTTDVSSVTCNVCRTEIGRLTSYIEELVDGLGGRVFYGILEDAGVFDRRQDCDAVAER